MFIHRGACCAVLGLGVVWPLAGQDAPRPMQPLRYDLSRPLCQQMQLSPELIGALTPPSAEVLEVPAGVRVALPVGGVGAVHIGAVSGGVGAVTLEPRLPAPTGGGQSALLLVRARSGERSSRIDAGLRHLATADLVRAIAETPQWRPENEAYLDRLAAALVDGGHVDVARPASLPSPARLAMADYLARGRDARCVALYEHLLAERGLKPGWPPELGGLAHYYRRTARFDEAARTWLRCRDYSTEPAALLDFGMEAGRDLMRTEQAERGLALLRQAASTALERRDAWVANLALCELAWWQINHGEAEAALATLAGGDALLDTVSGPSLLLMRLRANLALGRRAAAEADLDQAMASLATLDPAASPYLPMVRASAAELGDWLASSRRAPLNALRRRFVLPPSDAGPREHDLVVDCAVPGELSWQSTAAWLACSRGATTPQEICYLPRAVWPQRHLLRLAVAPGATGQAELRLALRGGEPEGAAVVTVTIRPEREENR